MNNEEIVKVSSDIKIKLVSLFGEELKTLIHDESKDAEINAGLSIIADTAVSLLIELMKKHDGAINFDNAASILQAKFVYGIVNIVKSAVVNSIESKVKGLFQAPESPPEQPIDEPKS